MHKVKLIISTILLVFFASVVTAETTVIHAGTLLSVPGENPLSKQSLIVKNGAIHEIRKGYVQIEGSRHIDLSCCFVLPGLIDLHVHLTTPVKAGGSLRVVTETSADLALTAARFARMTLDAGFTTVLDLGTGRRQHEEAIYALRKATREHRLPGPRIIAVGSPISPSGHSRTGLYRSDVEKIVGPEGVCNGVDDCRRAVREQVKRGADAINFYNTGSLLDEYLVEQTFTDEEMLAIVETAHALGRKVIADGHTARGVNAALRAGADIVDTVPWPDAETWKLLKKSDAYFSPHLYAFEVSLGDTEESLRSGTTHWLPEPILRRLLSVKENPYSAEAAYKHGVKIAFGSDTGVIEHGDNAGEFAELLKVGLTSEQALITATINAASAIGLQNQIGQLSTGFAADIIAVSGNPLNHIEELSNVIFVMRDGVVYKSPE
ncbi:MAG: amidohydrolase family protein [Gammaproteobacteria bacterium]|nr:amidohydrolase family protein [Gammaproteobacteria bacterium]